MPDGTPELVHTSTRWVGSGRTVLNNKGNPVKQYEPFFWDSPDYETEEDLVKWGVSPLFTYDAIGRATRIDMPNGSYRMTEWDAWQETAWDENDTVTIGSVESAWYTDRQLLPSGDPERRASDLTLEHANTPTVTHVDLLGRPFLVILDNGASSTPRYLATRSELDIEGQVRKVTDALSASRR